MKKVKITEIQKIMLETKANAKMTNELDIRPSLSPSTKISRDFKDQTKNIQGLKTENEVGSVQWTELVPHVHELIKQMYTKPTKEEMNPFWEDNGVSWDEIIGLLTNLELIKSVKGGYRLTKIVEKPAKAIKIVAKLLEKLINDKKGPVDEMNHDDIKNSLKKQITDKPKNTKTRVEILKIIADKRAAELARREKENNKPIGEIDEDNGNVPMGTEYDSNSPWNQSELKPNMSANKIMMDVIWYDSDFAVLKGEGKLWIYNIESADKSEYANYAARDETFYGRDEDGDPMVEYGDWDMDESIIENYVNDNLEHLSRGKGLDDFENGVELVEVDQSIADYFIDLAKYIGKRNPKEAAVIVRIFSSFTTTDESSINNGGVISEHDPEQAPFLDRLKSLFNNGEVGPEQWLSYSDELEAIVMGLKDNGNYDSIIHTVIKMLKIADVIIDGKVDPTTTNQIVNEFTIIKNELASEIAKEATLPVSEVTSTGTAGNYAYDAPMGDGGNFWTAGNKLNKKMKNEVTARQDKDAFKDTQWPDGHFVELDTCVKPNNNKKAQNGGCSVGAVDNVVKTKSSKHSVVSDSSIYERIAKSTGRSVDEVKSIIDKKISKSK
jgi:hypothetical protein